MMAGFAAAVAGVALISVPAALIIGGTVMFALAALHALIVNPSNKRGDKR
jgi:hypothetical protein